MDIITLFCEIDDFFSRMNNIKHNTSCQKHLKQAIHVADPETFIRANL